MFTRHKETAPRRQRAGLESCVLLQDGDVPDTQLAVTWVEVAPGARQIPHSHAPEQVYVIVSGRGVMMVGDEEQAVTAGEMVRIPPHTPHGIRNETDHPLAYVSAATPTLDITARYDDGDLRPEAYETAPAGDGSDQ